MDSISTQVLLLAVVIVTPGVTEVVFAWTKRTYCASKLMLSPFVIKDYNIIIKHPIRFSKESNCFNDELNLNKVFCFLN
ncbi:MAG: hypothetical protein DLM72_17690 [Candidatus Nitrosopolaris wilkensis]|nr:MAG: hypothetical protein DLM72_17690 [Candidatus Nitrosopolaris wilkensis]